MNKTGRYLVLFAVFALLFTASCARKEPSNKVQGKPQGSPQARRSDAASPQDKSAGASEDAVKHKVLSFNLEGLSEKGEKKWDVKGESAEAISENEIRLDNIIAKAYGEEAQAVITADQGVYDKAKNNVKLEKNVKATIESKSGFGGGFGDFSGQGSEGKAKPKDTASGKGPDKRTKTVINCDGDVLFDYERNIADFNNNVHVDSEDGSIIADKITVHLDSDTKQVSRIIAEGNVRIKRGENMTYSDKATYDAVTKKVNLVGRPKLVIYQEGGSGGVDTNFMSGMPGKKQDASTGDKVAR